MSKGIAFLDLKNKEILFSGNWTIWSNVDSIKKITDGIKKINSSDLTLKLQDNTKWDSVFVVILLDILKLGKKNSISIDLTLLPASVLKLLDLSKEKYLEQDQNQNQNQDQDISNSSQSKSLKNNKENKEEDQKETLIRKFIKSETGKKLYDSISFFGDWLYAHLLLLQGKVKFRSKDYFELLRNSSVEALPIITLISFLSGVVLAYVGLVQLETFGAEILIANLIGFGVLRDMGALMAAVVMSGRTGASYAAQLGTMNSNDEIDALSSFNINPMHFLVMPRTLALIFMMPLLTVYADIIGLIAGAVIACSTTDISVTEYYTQTVYALGVNDFFVGIIKSVAFGIVIAFFGCYYGINSGKKAQDVGNSATHTVVTSIVFIVIFDAIFTVFFSLVKF